jgi:hypothetical protein
MNAWHKILLWLVACATSALALPLALAPAPASAAGTAPPGSPSFIFAPYSTAATGVIRASFHYTLPPGTTITDRLVLANPSSQEQTFRIWSADAYNTSLSGALALRIDGYPMTQVGTWIKLPTGAADYGVSPGSEVLLQFALTVPPNAIPGDHVGGIEALDVSPPPANTGPNRVLVHEGIGVPIFINVPGPRHPSAAVTLVNTASSVPALSFVNGTSDARVGYQVQNTGNTILRGGVHVWVTNLFGQTVKTFPSNIIGNLLPGQQANYVEPLWKSLPIGGPQTVHVTFSPVGAKSVSGSSTFWIIPWVLIIVILLVLLAVAAWLWRRHRRKVAAAGEASDKAATQASKSAGEAAPKEPVHTA